MGEVITIEQGGGGSLMKKLIEEVIVSAYDLDHVEGGIGLPEMDDGATIPLNGRQIVFTTDAYTAKPLFFPGSDIGRLAVYGTSNDIAVMGARPLALACWAVRRSARCAVATPDEPRWIAAAIEQALGRGYRATPPTPPD